MLNVRKKLFAIVLLALAAICGVGYLLLVENPLRGILPQAYTADYAYVKVVGNIRTGLKEIEASELEYAFSGEPSYLSAFGDAAAILLRNISELKSMSRDSTGRLVRVEGIEPLINERIQFTEKIISAHAKGGKRSASALLHTGEGKRTAAEINKALAALDQDGFRASAYQDRAVRQGIRKGLSLIATGYGFVVVILVLAFVVVGREVSRFRAVGRDLAEARQRLGLLSDGMKDCALVMLAPDGTTTSWNSDAERQLGYSAAEMAGKHFSHCFSEEDVKVGQPSLSLKTAETEGPFEQMSARVRKDGQLLHVHSTITALRDPDGALRGFSVLTRDVTEQKRAEELLTKLSLSVEQAGDLVMITDRAGRLEYVNRSVEEVTGYSREELLAGGLSALKMDQKNPGRYRAMWDTALSGRAFHAEMTAVRKDGAAFFLDQLVTPIKTSSGNVTHLVFTCSDLTPVKQLRDRLDFLASYDTLTGLPNRDLFLQRLNRELSTGKARPLAVLTIDIDRFKYLNEIYGMEAGNSVLKQVAESLSVSVNKGDLVGRLGSDEFGIALHDVRKPADVVLFVKMIMKNVPQIVMAGGQEISVTLAIGIAVHPADGTDASTLMKNADVALGKAKAQGRNHYQFYTRDMNEGISELVFMERRLTDALRNKEYTLAYQPYYHLASKKVAGAEALLRWNNNEFGLVSPSKFIPMLEETGMITDVGNWVLRTACGQIRQWTNGKGHLPISVNLSLSQFRNEYLVDTVQTTIRELSIDPQRLVLEVTESIFMKDQEFAVSVLKRLKAIGVCISIDDFGTGYSSLSYLKKFPVDIIKIDQSFVRDVATDPDTTSLVAAIISMAHGLNLKAIAEGVETEEQWKILRLLKCDMAQGYYCSLALSPQDFERVVG